MFIALCVRIDVSCNIRLDDDMLLAARVLLFVIEIYVFHLRWVHEKCGSSVAGCTTAGSHP
jgi:hypothetical protein